MSGSIVSPALRARVRGIAVPIALGLGRLGLTPNSLTILGFGIAVVAAVAASQQAWVLAGLLVIFGGVFDLFDGALARATNRVSRLGAFLDSVFDRAGEAVLYVGIATGSAWAGFGEGAISAAAAMGASFMVSYTRAKSEGLGFTAGTRMAAVGVMPREVRLIILSVGLVVAGLLGMGPAAPLRSGAGVLGLALAIIAVGATITVIQRIIHVMQQAVASDGK